MYKSFSVHMKRIDIIILRLIMCIVFLIVMTSFQTPSSWQEDVDITPPNNDHPVECIGFIILHSVNSYSGDKDCYGLRKPKHFFFMSNSSSSPWLVSL